MTHFRTDDLVAAFAIVAGCAALVICVIAGAAA